MRKRRGVSRLLLGLLVLAFALPLAFFGYQEIRWRQMSSYADEVLIELQMQDSSRPVPYGEARAGDAWGDYTRAVELIDEAAEEGWREWLRATQEGELAEANRRRDIVTARYAEAIYAMQEGAQRERARAQIAWEQGHEAPMTSLFGYRSLANLSILRAEQLLDKGQGMPAVELLLDVMQLGRDHMHTPRVIDEMIGQALLSIGVEAILEGGLLEKGLIDRLARPELAALERGLRRLDEGLVLPSRAMQGEMLLFVKTAVSDGFSEGQLKACGWRFGFSTKLMLADAAAESRAEIEIYMADPDEPWPQRAKRLAALDEARTVSANPVTRMMGIGLRNYDGNWRSTLARLRMLRMAVDYRRGREIVPLPDPFGGELRYEVEGEQLAIWTRGRGDKPNRRDRVELDLKPAAPSGR